MRERESGVHLGTALKTVAAARPATLFQIWPSHRGGTPPSEDPSAATGACREFRPSIVDPAAAGNSGFDAY